MKTDAYRHINFIFNEVVQFKDSTSVLKKVVPKVNICIL